MPSSTKSEYRMSFSFGGLFLNESIEASRLFSRLGDWRAVRHEMITAGAFRTESSAKRTVREVLSRLQTLSDTEIALLAEGNLEEQALLLWLAVCRTYEFVAEFAAEVLCERFLSFRVELGYDAFDAFFEAKAEWNPDLSSIRPSTRAKLRQVLFRMLREAGIISASDEIRRTIPSPRLESLISATEARWLPGVQMTAGGA